MRSYHIKKFLIVSAVILSALLSGCKYDVAEPLWTQEYNPPESPVITGIIPANAATPGINRITILGEKFSPFKEKNTVYFDNVEVDVLSSTTTSITVLRPKQVFESCTIKVVSDSAFLVAKYGPYKVDPVLEKYGSFLDNIQLSVLAADANELLYVIDGIQFEIYKVPTEGEKSVIGKANRPPTDACIGPDGNMYYLGNNRAIDVVDVQTGTASLWLRLPSGKVVKYGDFDSNGYFYCGGRRSQLVTVAPDLTVNSTGIFASDEIVALEVAGDYVYSAVITASPDAQNPALAIWRNQILGQGNVRDKELVLDLANIPTGDTLDVQVTGLDFSADGKMYIGLNSPNSMVVVDLATKEIESFYKGILPEYCKFFSWGKSNFVYMISGDTILGIDWTIHRVDMGIISAP